MTSKTTKLKTPACCQKFTKKHSVLELPSMKTDISKNLAQQYSCPSISTTEIKNNVLFDPNRKTLLQFAVVKRTFTLKLANRAWMHESTTQDTI